jgi:hypothetical protein
MAAENGSRGDDHTREVGKGRWHSQSSANRLSGETVPEQQDRLLLRH